jgi:Asp/Glu/hydantoin racemase
MLRIARESLPADAAIHGVTAAAGAPVITDEAALAIAAEAVASIAAALDPGAWDGVIIGAFGDPGLEAARACLPVPVTGLAEAALREAGAGGRRFAIVTTTPGLDDAIRRRVALYGLAGQLASLRFTPAPPAALMADPARLEAALLAASRLAVAQDGADAIVIGGGPLAVAARALRDQLDVPLIEPVPCAVDLAIRRAVPGSPTVRETRHAD